jgi:hypothetical protein
MCPTALPGSASPNTSEKFPNPWAGPSGQVRQEVERRRLPIRHQSAAAALQPV